MYKLKLFFGFDIYLVIIFLEVWKVLRWIILVIVSSNNNTICKRNKNKSKIKV